MKNYLRKKDKLADAPGMSYKGEETYGTSIGGCCSLFATIFVSIYFTVIIFDFSMKQSFNSDVETLYHSANDTDKYELKPNDLIPAF